MHVAWFKIPGDQGDAFDLRVRSAILDVCAADLLRTRGVTTRDGVHDRVRPCDSGVLMMHQPTIIAILFRVE